MFATSLEARDFSHVRLHWIKYCSKMKHYDERNKASVKACEKVQQLIITEGLGLPFI